MKWSKEQMQYPCRPNPLIVRPPFINTKSLCGRVPTLPKEILPMDKDNLARWILGYLTIKEQVYGAIQSDYEPFFFLQLESPS